VESGRRRRRSSGAVSILRRGDSVGISGDVLDEKEIDEFQFRKIIFLL